MTDETHQELSQNYPRRLLKMVIGLAVIYVVTFLSSQDTLFDFFNYIFFSLLFIAGIVLIRATAIMKRIYLLILIFAAPFLSNAQTKGSFIDARDGRNYATVTYTLSASDSVISDLDEYGTYATNERVTYEIIFTESMPLSMTWMAQNLNYEMEESKCFNDSDVNCDSHGRQYTWFASKKACPKDWHLPSDDEWYLLANQYGGVASAGKHLKSSEFGGTNKSLLDIKKSFIYWSSDEMDTEYAWDWKVNFRWEKLQRWKGGKSAYNSVRCIQDY